MYVFGSEFIYLSVRSAIAYHQLPTLSIGNSKFYFIGRSARRTRPPSQDRQAAATRRFPRSASCRRFYLLQWINRVKTIDLPVFQRSFAVLPHRHVIVSMTSSFSVHCSFSCLSIRVWGQKRLSRESIRLHQKEHGQFQ